MSATLCVQHDVSACEASAHCVLPLGIAFVKATHSVCPHTGGQITHTGGSGLTATLVMGPLSHLPYAGLELCLHMCCTSRAAASQCLCT